MRSRKVLVLASEPMLAAFLGMMLELDSYEPAFAEPGENAEDALARVRPVLVILLHTELDASRSDLFFVRAGRAGAKVILFGAAEGGHVRALARERKVPFFEMPVDRRTLARVVGDIDRDPARMRSLVDRRVTPRAFDSTDGTFCFADDAGEVWRVYDRRAGERRARPLETMDASYRVFINERGEERRYRPGYRESLEISVEALSRQLAAATAPQAGED